MALCASSSPTVCVSQEGRTIKLSSGFKGKGFKFDEMEAQLADDRKKLQKAALGLHDSDDEDAGMDVSGCCVVWGWKEGGLDVNSVYFYRGCRHELSFDPDYLVLDILFASVLRVMFSVLFCAVTNDICCLRKMF